MMRAYVGFAFSLLLIAVSAASLAYGYRRGYKQAKVEEFKIAAAVLTFQHSMSDGGLLYEHAKARVYALSRHVSDAVLMSTAEDCGPIADKLQGIPYDKNASSREEDYAAFRRRLAEVRSSQK